MGSQIGSSTGREGNAREAHLGADRTGCSMIPAAVSPLAEHLTDRLTPAVLTLVAGVLAAAGVKHGLSNVPLYGPGSECSGGPSRGGPDRLLDDPCRRVPASRAPD